MPHGHDPLGGIRSEVVALLSEALHALRYDDAIPEVDARLEPAPPGKGDFAFPCFTLAKVARKAPPQIAEELLDALPEAAHVDARAEGPYLNFTVDSQHLAKRTLRAILERGGDYGKLPERDDTVIVEHTSANPNGPFHVGRARNPIVGDTVARILRAAGYHVTTEYYVNDMGKQVAILTWGLQNLEEGDVGAPERPKEDFQRVRYYQKANERQEQDSEVAAAINDLLRRFEEGDEEVAHDFRSAAATVLNGMRETLGRLNVTMDSFFWESDLVISGDARQVIGKLQKSDLAGDEEGAAFLELESYGIHGKSTKWFFTRKDGTSLYTTRDLAYHQNKFNRADRAVNILGEDHKLTMQQLNAALDILGEKKRPEVVWISFVSLPEGKMSTRRNRVVFVDDLLDEAHARALEEVKARRSEELNEAEMERIAEMVGIGAVRFNIASVQAEKSITFRWEDALNFDGDSAPFVQYAHARAASILRKAEEEGHNPVAHAERVEHPSEVALVRALAKLPRVVGEAAETLRIHHVPPYAVEVANAFNQFYRDCHVLGAEDPKVRANRLALTDAARQVLANTLALVGVHAPDSM